MQTVSKSYALFFAGFFALSGAAHAQVYQFSGTFSADYAHHVSDPQTPASEKATLKLKQTAKFNSSWSGVAEGQGWIDGVFAGGNEYPREARADLYELRLQDAYLRYKSGEWDLRAGNQQQAWGETFGSYTADIVNPKDLRFGIPLDPSRTTLSTPQISLKYILGEYSIQGIYIPKPAFNILPLPGEDFFPKFPELATVKNFKIIRERDLPLAARNGEYGLRLSGSFKRVDISVFGLDYFDRNPYYEIGLVDTPTQTLVLNERHARVSSGGLTFAMPIGDQGYMVRGEAVYTTGRSINVLNRDYTLRSTQISDVSGAIALEIPPWQRLNLAMQFSTSQWIDWAKYVTRSRQDVDYLSVRAALGLFQSSTWSTIVTWSLLDSGFRVLSDFSSPLSNNSELSLGTELYGGSSSSDFSQIQRASRVYILFRFFFHG